MEYCQSSNDASQTQSAVELESDGFNIDYLISLKPVSLTHGRTDSVASSGVPGNQPSMTKKQSEQFYHRLLVKGFTFDYIQKKVRKMSPGDVIDDRNGYTNETRMAPEMAASLASHIHESSDVQRQTQPQNRCVDASLLNSKTVSEVSRKCGQKMEGECDSGNTVRLTAGCEMANDLLGDSIDTDAVAGEGLGSAWQPLVGSDENMSSMTRCGFAGDGVKAVVVHKRGRPRKRPLSDASLSNENTSVTAKCHLQENWNMNSVPLRKRGRPRKVATAVINENLLVTTKCGEDNEYLHENGAGPGETEKSNQVVGSSTDTNTFIRRRGRPPKRTMEDTVLDDKQMLMMRKHGLHKHYNAYAATVRRRGRPCKRPLDHLSLNGLNVLTRKKCIRWEEHLPRPLPGDSLSNESKSITAKCCLQDTNSVPVRKRGRPRKVATAVINENLLVTTMCGEDNEYPCENGTGRRETEEKANQVVGSSTATNTFIRRRGRPPKRTMKDTVLGDKQIFMMRKHGLHKHYDANAATVRRRGRPCKRPLDDLSLNGLTVLTT